MGLKIFKALWFLSMLAALANLLYVYASLPESVLIQDASGSPVSVGREGFFYLFTLVIAFINAMVYLISGVYKKDLEFRSWFHGLVTTLNFFFIVSLSFVALFNSGEKYAYGEIDFIIFGSIALFVLWALSWPLYVIYRRRRSRSISLQ